LFLGDLKDIASFAGKGLTVAGKDMDGFMLGTELRKSTQTGYYGNTIVAASGEEGGWAGAAVGASLGAPRLAPALPLWRAIVDEVAGGALGCWAGSTGAQFVLTASSGILIVDEISSSKR
jgi:hypothetical protein